MAAMAAGHARNTKHVIRVGALSHVVSATPLGRGGGAGDLSSTVRSMIQSFMNM